MNHHDLYYRSYSAVTGFMDSLILFKEMYPRRKCYKQTFLVIEFSGHSYNAHNAIDDVTSLQNLIDARDASLEKMKLMIHQHL